MQGGLTLLAQVTSAGCKAPQLPSAPDWVECQEVCEELQAAGEYGMLMATEHMARLYLGWRPPTTRQVHTLAHAQGHHVLSCAPFADYSFYQGGCVMHGCMFSLVLESIAGPAQGSFSAAGQVSDWCARRALEVDSRSGLLGVSDELLALAGQRSGGAAAGAPAQAVREAASRLATIAQAGEPPPAVLPPFQPAAGHPFNRHGSSCM